MVKYGKTLYNSYRRHDGSREKERGHMWQCRGYLTIRMRGNNSAV